MRARQFFISLNHLVSTARIHGSLINAAIEGLNRIVSYLFQVHEKADIRKDYDSPIPRIGMRVYDNGLGLSIQKA
jgi:hypothetical protein